MVEEKLNSNTPLTYQFEYNDTFSVMLYNIHPSMLYINRTVMVLNLEPQVAYDNLSIIYSFSIQITIIGEKERIEINKNDLFGFLYYPLFVILYKSDNSFIYYKPIYATKVELNLGTIEDYTFFNAIGTKESKNEFKNKLRNAWEDIADLVFDNYQTSTAVQLYQYIQETLFKNPKFIVPCEGLSSELVIMNDISYAYRRKSTYTFTQYFNIGVTVEYRDFTSIKILRVYNGYYE